MRRALPTLLVATLLALAIAPAATTPPPLAPLRLRLLIDSALAGVEKPFEAFDTYGLNLVDLLGDGHLKIVTNNDNRRTYVVDPETGRALSELKSYRPGYDRWSVRDMNGIAVGDVTGNGSVNLAVLNSASYLTLFELDREASAPDRLVWQRVWWRLASAPHWDKTFFDTHPWLRGKNVSLGADGNAYVAEIPGEKGMWTFVQSDGFPGAFAFDRTGELRWNVSHWDGNGGPWVGKLRPSQPPRAVTVSDGGVVAAMDAKTGKIQWTFDARAKGADPGSISVMANVYDLDGNGKKEIFVGARVAVNNSTDGSTDWIHDQHAKYFLLDADGREIWSAAFDWGNPMIYMHPAATDLNADGVQDLVALDWNTIGHSPGDWEKTGDANLFALDGRSGKALWHVKVSSAWSNKGIAIADFIPGGAEEILLERQRGKVDGLSLYDLKGREVAWIGMPDASWRVMRGPVLGDVDADGLLEVVVPLGRASDHCVQTPQVGCREGALAIYDTEAPADDPIFSANFLFNSKLDASSTPGRVSDTPLVAKPPPPPPPPKVNETLSFANETPKNGTKPPVNETKEPPVDEARPPTRIGAQREAPGLGALAALIALGLSRRHRRKSA